MISPVRTTVGEAVGTGVGLLVDVGVGEAVGTGVRLLAEDGVGEAVGIGVRLLVGVGVGEAVGSGVGVGDGKARATGATGVASGSSPVVQQADPLAAKTTRTQTTVLYTIVAHP